MNTLLLPSNAKLYQSKLGYHVCSYELYKKLKTIRKYAFQALSDRARWHRWKRKDPINRVKWIFDSKCGVYVSTPIAEPSYNYRLFIDFNNINHLYNYIRMPYSLQEVRHLTPETVNQIDLWYKTIQF